jgi:hypothetical protein
MIENSVKYLTFGCNGKFNLRSVKALGIHMAVERYRTSEPGEEEDVDSWALDPLLPFPYKALPPSKTLWLPEPRLFTVATSVRYLIQSTHYSTS